MPDTIAASSAIEADVRIITGAGALDGVLTIPAHPLGVVIFAHGSGSSRHSSRNRRVAQALVQRGMATLLFDLLTLDEERADAIDGHLRFNIPLLAGRLVEVTNWVQRHDRCSALRIGYFGASTGAAAALMAAAELPAAVAAIVSRGGRPDLAGDALGRVRAPTLLIVGGLDTEVITLNRKAFERITTARARAAEIVPNATHLFPEPGALEQVTALAIEWFERHLTGTAGTPER